MLVVSLTGGIASGKSTTSRLLSSPPYALPLIDLDLVAREVVQPNDASRTLEKLVRHFGESILQPDGTLNRPALGRLTFGTENESNRKVLNKYTHTAIRKRMAWRLFKYWMTGCSIVIIDTPLAVEAGLWKFCGEMIVVWCPPETQLSRMIKRDGDKGLTEEDANHRLSSQLSLEKKLPYADIVLDNADGVSETLEEQVKGVVERWKRERSQGLGRLRTLVQWLVPPVGVLMAAWSVYSRTSRVARRKAEAEAKQRTE
ncbi:hypothetical protein CBS101457_001176 [Exobasidium rhododendri]|nr:hypothetical protein CBS101457_001176 [Exobasidium rhododendri]